MSSTSKIARILFVVTICCSMVTEARAQEYVQWSFDLNQATQVAASENKLVLLHFTATWCAPCKELDRFVFVNPTTIQALSAHVIPVKIDVDAQKYVADKYQVTSVPTDVIITPTGHVVSRQPSPRSSDGYLQMLSHAKAASENLSSTAIAGQSSIRQAISVNQPMESPQNGSQFQTASGGNFSPGGVPLPGQFANAGSGTVTNSFYGQNQNQNQNQVQNQNLDGSMLGNQSFSAAPGSIRMNQQGSFQPAQSTTIRNEFATSSSSPASGGNFGAGPIIESGGMKRVDNPYVTQPEKKEVVMQPASTAEGSVTRENSALATTHAVSLPPIGLDGFCGVTLMEDQKWVKGDEKFGCIHRGKLYFFASQDHLDRFQMTPDMFSPLLGGADPVAFHKSGKLVDGKRKLGVFYGEPGEPSLIVLFDSEENRERFEADPPTFVQSVRQAMSQVDGNTLIR